MCLFQSLPHSGDDVSGIDISAASNTTSPATTPSAEVNFNFNLNYVINFYIQGDFSRGERYLRFVSFFQITLVPPC